MLKFFKDFKKLIAIANNPDKLTTKPFEFSMKVYQRNFSKSFGLVCDILNVQINLLV